MESVEKPIYKRTWFIVCSVILGVLVLIRIFGPSEAELKNWKADAKRKDSLELVEQKRKSDRINDSITAAYNALPKRVKDSIVKAKKAEEERIQKENEIRDKTENYKSYVEADLDWRVGGFGTVALGEIKIKNKSLRTVKNFKVRIAFNGESGKELSDWDGILPIVVKPGKSRRTEELNFGFVNKMATSASVSIVSMEVE